jgi:RimJ/RimL family protein N-acetyltransferase
MAAFLTVFVPNLERTREYLSAFSLPDPARILFLIADRDRRYIGHIGLCNIAAGGAEIDNVIRGEPTDTPDLMVRAHNALLGWAFINLDIPLVYLNVLSDNARAMRTYEKVDLRRVSTTPLMREEREDGYRLVPARSGGSNAGVALMRMEIARDTFLANERENVSARSIP